MEVFIVSNNSLNLQNFCEDSINQLLCLKSIIKTTQASCLERENSAKYYDLPPEYKFTLSEERSQYIDMLDIDLDKVCNVIALNTNIENAINGL